MTAFPSPSDAGPFPDLFAALGEAEVALANRNLDARTLAVVLSQVRDLHTSLEALLADPAVDNLRPLGEAVELRYRDALTAALFRVRDLRSSLEALEETLSPTSTEKPLYVVVCEGKYRKEPYDWTEDKAAATRFTSEQLVRVLAVLKDRHRPKRVRTERVDSEKAARDRATSTRRTVSTADPR